MINEISKNYLWDVIHMKKMTVLNNFNEYSIDKKAAKDGGLKVAWR
ncbi:MAG: hypothetical protein Q8K92_04155 [Leadbetterella sp.]|nr:hypothetical protein [Leadbetterella sp.]